jgi:hypothetical protein
MTRNVPDVFKESHMKEVSMKTLLVVAAIVVALSVPQLTLAQTSPSANAATAVQITEARKADAALLRQYSWSSRTEVLDQGQVKDIRIELVNY